ncbi:MAG TPA: glycogen synthase GlgA [Geobacteraceae bacterium]
MKILMISSEVAPFAQTGGMADVTASLAKALKRLGHDVRLFMPSYRCVQKLGVPLRKARKSVEVPIGEMVSKGYLRQAYLDDVPVYLLESKEYFDRDDLYGTSDGDYPDNHRRFAFFCRGILEVLKKLDFRPDLLHCHDWQTALVPIILRYEHHSDAFFANTATLFTIHNLAYQGVFPRTALEEMGLNKTCYRIERLEFFGQLNLMKGAILTSDLLNTVSESYCREIQTPEAGCGLDGVLSIRSGQLSGILNGLDTEEWDPASDQRIFKQFSPDSLAAKAINKKGLQKLLGLEVNPDVPLIGIVSRLVEQKGLNLLEQLLPRLAGEELQLVILGSGDSGISQRLSSFAKQSRNFSFNLGFNPELAPKIYAGADMFLMPSHFEPCGISQMIALRYGAVPVVRRTGGLGDTVTEERVGNRQPNGFTFDDYTPEALWEVIRRALEAYRNKAKWRKLMRSGMVCDFSWLHSARRYEELYRRCLEKKRG